MFHVELDAALPNELPANTLRLDTAWRMTDGQIFHLEFQSAPEMSLYRFLEYDARLAHAYKTSVRTVVLYHGDTRWAPSRLHIGTAAYGVENVYLSMIDGEAALDTVSTHWDAQDRLRLALALNMQVNQRSTALERVVSLVVAVPDAEERDLVVSAILVLGEAGLTEAQRTWIRKELRQVSKMAEELYQEGREEGRQEGKRDQTLAFARKLLALGESVEKVATLTELSLDDVQKLRATQA
ncbi:MAG: hypothetical protein M1415_03955 [Firmicutes bacterium]|nr:hypothetical protein [Bacillota bacterium]